MNRRNFLAASSGVGLGLAVSAGKSRSVEAALDREVYELRRYLFESQAQADAFVEFMGKAGVPALNRAGVEHVGVFVAADVFSPVYVLLPHKSIEGVAALTGKLLADEIFMKEGADFLNVSYERPNYTRIEGQLLLAFEGMPRIEIPTKSADRVLQLRTYESPTLIAANKKIEMFNSAEIGIFRKTGLNPVFFGETLAGVAMPNLTYMVGFENKAAQDAAWKAFLAHPEWKSLSSQPEYAKKNLVSNITNLVLKPAACSQV